MLTWKKLVKASLFMGAMLAMAPPYARSPDWLKRCSQVEKWSLEVIKESIQGGVA